ncbi:MAG: phosphatidate cytidylyltransferase [Planctomycetia bacterium]
MNDPAIRLPEDPHAPARRAARGAFGPRAAVAVAVIAAFTALAWADATGAWGARPAWWLLPVALLLAALGARELVVLLAAAGRPVAGPIVVAGAAGIVLAAAAGGGTAAVAPATLGWVAAACMAVLAACFIEGVARYRPGGHLLGRIAAGVLAAVGLGLPLSFLVALRLLARPSIAGAVELLGILPLLSLVAVVKAGDIAAYIVGSLVGRHRMAPLLSPGKTWEGATASLVASVAVAWLVLTWLPSPAAAQPWGGWLAYGLAVGAAGMAGDLAESLVKRDLGAKDSGTSLGGLGGVLDLVDSLLLAAPAAWLLWVAG